ncbi:hypothetical protein B0T19DRAFT_6425 [Cercophora scortea]|uniref:Uncharacterized protein n=1 Tax=Cercophora scortea TaxID=314031 RepID=A0AAE0J364_9PEZI|nr:hypothetical protein B0T19DRAFT_6425 [Cercophora scortea]
MKNITYDGASYIFALSFLCFCYYYGLVIYLYPVLCHDGGHRSQEWTEGTVPSQRGCGVLGVGMYPSLFSCVWSIWWEYQGLSDKVGFSRHPISATRLVGRRRKSWVGFAGRFASYPVSHHIRPKSL